MDEEGGPSAFDLSPFKDLPFPERFAHKNWKVRQDGYIDAAAEFGRTTSENSPIFKPFLHDPSIWKAAVGDSNVAAQSDALVALCAYIKNGGMAHTTTVRPAVVPVICEKGLPGMRPATKANSLEALMLLCEVDRADHVLEHMMPSLSAKLPKIIAATLGALTAMYHAFGVRVVDPKPVLKALPKMFAHADKNVRAEATKLAVEIYRWLKEAGKAMFWDELKPVQQADLQKLFDPLLHENPRQERLTRAQEAAKALAEAKAAETVEEEAQPEAEEEEAEDMSDLVPGFDVLAAMPPDFTTLMDSKKWSDRKEALDGLLAVANVAKIKAGPYDEVVSLLGKSMKDINVMVVISAAECVAALARGLKSNFAPYKTRVFKEMFERLKERKAAVIEALGNGLDGVFVACGLSDLLETIVEYTKNKNPQIKLESAKFLGRCLCSTPVVPMESELKVIAEPGIRLITETAETTRTAGFEILAIMKKLVGERMMRPYLEPLDEHRMKKINDIFETVTVKAKARPPPAPKAAAAPPGAAKKGPPMKKTLPGGPGAKKPTGNRAFSPEVPAAPSPAKPSARPTAMAKPGGVPRSGMQAPGAGMKPVTKRPGVPSSGAINSPRKLAPTPPLDEYPTAPPPKSALGRVPPARTLGRTGAGMESSYQPAASSTVASVDKGELLELRVELDRLRKANDELHAEKARMELEMNAMKVHEAELIEERTRNTLTIKAKETQLVRARSDAEEARETVDRQQREIERLKRELSRTARALSPLPHDSSEQVYRDQDEREIDRAHEIGYNRARTYMSPSEEKENGVPDSMARHKSALPSRTRYDGEREATGGEKAQPIESWRRAAEVTSQLKARIELMKARNGLARPGA